MPTGTTESRPPMPRLPVEPLLALVAGNRPRFGSEEFVLIGQISPDEVASASWFAMVMRVSQRQIMRYMAGTTLSYPRAEAMCDAAGLHPAEVWPTLYHEQMDVHERAVRIHLATRHRAKRGAVDGRVDADQLATIS